MKSRTFSVPILFLVFNRLETTQRVFEAIRQAKPPRLYIAADGPRDNIQGEASKVEAVREYVMSHIDWLCEVKTLFRKKNLGCKVAVSSAIDWFFEHEEEGIILEDDCLPDASFFPFCAELLERYRLDDCVMMISGVNSHKSAVSSDSYYFSRYCNIWGWATWRRAWKHYDVTMRCWSDMRSKGILKGFSLEGKLYWSWGFDEVVAGRINSWDYQWVFACWQNRGLAVVPTVNLVRNIGFGSDGTHTKKDEHNLGRLQVGRIERPLRHPKNIVVDFLADRIEREKFYRVSLWKYVWRICKKKMGLV